jgi:hypothetical protein
MVRVMTAELFAAAFPIACVLTAGASSRGWPRLTGVGSGRIEGNPAGRSSGKTSKAPTTRACTPNDDKVVNPRRERSFHDELTVLVNMLSS